MPVLILPDDLRKQLEDSESGTINDTDGYGVAVYWKSDGSARADIYVGLTLDGFILYHSISSVNRTIKMQFSIPPIIFCQYGDVHFDPSKDGIISIYVSCRPCRLLCSTNANLHAMINRESRYYRMENRAMHFCMTEKLTRDSIAPLNTVFSIILYSVRDK